ncbi:MAG: menaquinone reductase molybdopterin-binding-like subunit QrcB, partial [Thermodesulfobacteriota bacterium]
EIAIWTQNWQWIPRIPKGGLDAKPSLLKLGAAEYGIRVNRVDKQPITVSGNPEHPLSLGGIDPLGGASVQLMYVPARIKTPLHRDKEGRFRPISWEKGLQLLTRKLKPLQGRPDGLACLSGDTTGSAREIISGFLRQMGSGHFYFPPGDAQNQHRTWRQMMQGQGSIGYDQENSDLVLALEPDILESWGTPVRNQVLFGRGKAEIIYAGAVQNNTGAVAHSWLPIKPGASGHLSLALAYHLLEQGIQPQGGMDGFNEYRKFVRAHYTPDQAAAKTGLDPSRIRGLARKLSRASRPLIVSGSASGHGAPGFTFFAGLSLNILLGRINAEGGLRCLPFPEKILPAAGDFADLQSQDLLAYIEDCLQGRTKWPEVLFVHEANPLYSLPDSGKSAKFFEAIPFRVSFSQFMDETAARSDLILPSPYFLERLDDSFTPFGSPTGNYSLSGPVLPPQTDSRETPDLFLELAGQLGLDLEIDSFADLLRARANRLGAGWEGLISGQTWTGAATVPQSGLRLWSQAIAAMCQAHIPDKDSPGLAVETNFKTGSARTGLTPFGLKTLREEELTDSLVSVRLNSRTAGSLGVREGQKAAFTSGAGTFTARILIDEGVMTGVVAAPSGFGHTDWDEFSRDKGDNVNNLLAVKQEPGSGISYYSAAGFKVKKEA